MAKFLIVYGTKQGQTQKIANFMRDELVRENQSVDIFDSESIPEIIKPQSYDAIIIGGPVYRGNFPKNLRVWTKAYSEVLTGKPSAFFSVCLGIMQKEASVQKDENEIVKKFLQQTGWTPKVWTIFAGALPYSKYNWFVKMIMKRITKKAGGDTDTSRDYDYTDWNQVQQFTQKFATEMNNVI